MSLASDCITVVVDCEPQIDVAVEVENPAVASVEEGGPAGLSAYESWLQLPGNAGKTLQQFFDAYRGSPGLSSTIAIGSVQTVSSDAPAAVVDVGQPGAAVFNFSIPRGLDGDHGPPGPPGANGAGYDFSQATPSPLWTIAHNLGFRPSVATFTVGGVEMIGTVTHLSANVVQIDFSIPVAGLARLN